MSWLGRAFTLGRSFLGAARTGAGYLGRAMPTVMSGLETAGRVASNPLVQQLGQKVGIDPSHFRTLARGTTNIGNALGMVPQAYSNVAGAVNALGAAAQSAMPVVAGAKRSLADVYSTAMGGA